MRLTLAPPALIRQATANDQGAINALVWSAGINPTGLRWRRFVVAEAGGRVVGTGQIKPHGDGSRELASIAVAPARRGEGIAGAIVRALQRRAGPPLYLTCESRLGDFYPRFGFRPLAPADMPPVLRRLHRVANLLIPVASPGRGLLVMGWDGDAGPA
jgi:N-acetylglutamate synthase-like GNAT family acetyltransferase